MELRRDSEIWDWNFDESLLRQGECFMNLRFLLNATIAGRTWYVFSGCGSAMIYTTLENLNC